MVMRRVLIIFSTCSSFHLNLASSRRDPKLKFYKFLNLLPTFLLFIIHIIILCKIFRSINSVRNRICYLHIILKSLLYPSRGLPLQFCLFPKMICSELLKSFKELQIEIKIITIIMEPENWHFTHFQTLKQGSVSI